MRQCLTFVEHIEDRSFRRRKEQQAKVNAIKRRQRSTPQLRIPKPPIPGYRSTQPRASIPSLQVQSHTMLRATVSTKGPYMTSHQQIAADSIEGRIQSFLQEVKGLSYAPFASALVRFVKDRNTVDDEYLRVQKNKLLLALDGVVDLCKTQSNALLDGVTEATTKEVGRIRNGLLGVPDPDLGTSVPGNDSLSVDLATVDGLFMLLEVAPDQTPPNLVEPLFVGQPPKVARLPRNAAEYNQILKYNRKLSNEALVLHSRSLESRVDEALKLVLNKFQDDLKREKTKVKGRLNNAERAAHKTFEDNLETSQEGLLALLKQLESAEDTVNKLADIKRANDDDTRLDLEEAQAEAQAKAHAVVGSSSVQGKASTPIIIDDDTDHEADEPAKRHDTASTYGRVEYWDGKGQLPVSGEGSKYAHGFIEPVIEDASAANVKTRRIVLTGKENLPLIGAKKRKLSPDGFTHE
ncbi:uncharacterized protein LY89DRAFT_713155 [Mollisia scopiformis]|uniref:Uncharacterized protein n=1 Tax=Mollisia scopiformis TaxID=149040 RepID=A0A194XVB2_MOLSC|nr:uncharacterized protein LY89DRAFT_713155 [Mollisia scopiformis]KUJ24270.1 hypothetical protein LY89DRAFT_713155 [Mollisia scopiformis]